jgi:hypothetical protein
MTPNQLCRLISCGKEEDINDAKEVRIVKRPTNKYINKYTQIGTCGAPNIRAYLEASFVCLKKRNATIHTFISLSCAKPFLEKKNLAKIMDSAVHDVKIY